MLPEKLIMAGIIVLMLYDRQQYPCPLFPNFSQGGGHRKSIFSQIQKSPNYPRGRGGQENYGLFPQFVTFHVWKAPLIWQIYIITK